MHALVWGTDANALQPVIHIFDSQDNPVALQVLANGGGLYSIQIANATAGATAYCPGVLLKIGVEKPRAELMIPPLAGGVGLRG